MIKIYLDQNIISNLRASKIKPHSIEAKLKTLLSMDGFIIIYSPATLAEIEKIPKVKYQKEHIDVLTELNATFIHYSHNELAEISHLPPQEALNEFKENLNFIEFSEIKEISDEIDNFFKAIAGCNTEKSASQSLLSTQDKLLELTKSFVNEIKGYSPMIASYINFAKEEAKKTFSLSNHINPKIDSLNISKLKHSPEIQNLRPPNINENAFINFLRQEKTLKRSNSLFETAMKTYTLLNIIGFHNDDYHKKNGKRFDSSKNDKLHTAYGVYANYLITEDTKLKKKANIVYRVLDVNSQSVKMEEFLKIIDTNAL